MTAALTTPEQIDRFAATAVSHGIKFYLDHGMQVNRAYTPTNMRAFVTRITGTTYARSKKGLTRAYNDLKALLDA